MEEEQTSPDAPESLETEDTNVTAAGEATTSNFPGLLVVGIVLVFSLIVAGLFLPPISLGQRLGLGGEEAAMEADDGPVAADTGTAETGDGAIALHLQEASNGVDLTAVAPDALAADSEMAAMAESLPANAEFRGDVYVVTYEGEAPTGAVSATIPETAETPALIDLYGWNGDAWSFIPTQPEEEGTTLVSAAMPAPRALALMETGAPENAAVGAEVLPTQSLPPAVLPTLTEVTAGTLTLAEDGSLEGEAVDVPTGGYRQLLRVTNTGVVVDQVSLAALLSDEALIAEHVERVAEAASDYAGVNVDYQGVAPGLRDTFTAFIADLAEALHADGKSLAVTLGTPAATDGPAWDSGGQDWQAIGQLADTVYVRMPLNPSAYAEGGAAEELVQWAVRQIHRHKLTLLISANAVDAVAGTYRELPNARALEHFGELSLMEGAEAVEPGTAVEVGLAGSASPLEWNADSMMYGYSYEQAGQTHTVWLNNEAAVSQRLQLAARYNLRGVALRGLGTLEEAEGYAQAIASYVDAAAAPEPAGAAIVWTVEDEAESVVASSSGESLSYRWEETEKPGRYTINAVFAQGDAVAKLGTVSVQIEEPDNGDEEEAPVAESTPEPEPEEETPEAAAPEAEPTAAPTLEPSDIDPGSADAVVNTPLNFRAGPGISYGSSEVLAVGTQVTLIGRNDAGDWVQVRLVDNPEREGWLYAQYLNMNSSVSVGGLPVVEVEPPAGAGGGNTAPPPPAAGNANFELGGQAFGAPYGQMQYAGMTWIKRQHKWSPGNTGQEVAGMISEAHNAGLKILLSIPGAQHSQSIDFNAYVEFLRNVASLPDPPDAIEVWNEMNIDREWPAGQISPQSYVQNMLAPAYQAIKGANGNIMVISGAPAPTGFYGGCSGAGCDDDAYVRGMAAAGAANYMDCIGIHYNEGIVPPSQESGDPRGASSHYTRYFWGMTNTYYNAFGGSRPLCYTELGYLTPEGYGSLPSGFSWAANTTVAEQAAWLAEAASLAANSGKVRLFIVWNVDSTTWGSDPQAGYAIIRPDGSCPACDTLRQVMGR